MRRRMQWRDPRGSDSDSPALSPPRLHWDSQEQVEEVLTPARVRRPGARLVLENVAPDSVTPCPRPLHQSRRCL